MTTSSTPSLDLQQGRDERPQHARQETAQDHDRDGEDGGHVVQDHPQAGRGDGACVQLAFCTDVEIAGGEGKSHRGPGQKQGSGRDQHFQQGAAPGQGVNQQSNNTPGMGWRAPTGSTRRSG